MAVNRAEIADRLFNNDPQIKAAIEYRRVEEDYHFDLLLDDINDPSFQPYRVWYLTPRINAAETFMDDLEDNYSLIIGGKNEEYIVGSHHPFDKRTFNVVESADATPRRGEIVEVFNSAISAYREDGRIINIFDATVIPLSEEDEFFFEN